MILKEERTLCLLNMCLIIVYRISIFSSYPVKTTLDIDHILKIQNIAHGPHFFLWLLLIKYFIVQFVAVMNLMVLFWRNAVGDFGTLG